MSTIILETESGKVSITNTSDFKTYLDKLQLNKILELYESAYYQFKVHEAMMQLQISDCIAPINEQGNIDTDILDNLYENFSYTEDVLCTYILEKTNSIGYISNSQEKVCKEIMKNRSTKDDAREIMDKR